MPSQTQNQTEPTQAAKRARILIADDHAMFAETLRTYLEKHHTVVGIVSDGRELTNEALRVDVDVIVVDVGMPFLNGLDAARRIREQSKKVKFVFLTMQDDPNLAAATLELGTVGFILKHSSGSELLGAIASVLDGKSYVTGKLRPQDRLESQSRARQFSKDLTPRQRDIVQLFGEGLTIKQIAGVLELSEKTVEFHKHHIMQTFGLKSNASLVLFALQRGLISLTPDIASRTETPQT
jgi:DNA-binding NarL/FixJ family response regulator